MHRVVKFGLLPLLGIIAAVGAVATYIAATFDPNQYKSQIVEAVKGQTGRTIRLEGDIKLSLFPGLGVTLGKVWLSEHASDREFAGIENIRIAMKLRPLLSKRIEIDSIEVRDLRANVVRTSDGKINIQDLAGGSGTTSGPANQRTPIKIDINHFTLRNATISYIDHGLNIQCVLRGLDLTTGHLASGVASTIDLSFVLQSDQAKLDLATKLKTTLTFDLESGHYALRGLNLEANGISANVSNLAVTARGDIEVNSERQELLLSTLSLAAAGKREGSDLSVKLAVPKAHLTPERTTGEGIMLNATSSKGATKIAVKFDVASVAGGGHAVHAMEATASLDWQDAAASVKAKATGALSGDLKMRTFELPKVMLTASATNPKLIKNGLDATINASAKADFTQQSAAMAFSARVDGSSVNGRAELRNFVRPFYLFDINIDRLDADRYLPEHDPKQRDDPFNLSTLKTLNATGSFRIGIFTMAGIKASNVRLDVKPDKGGIDIRASNANVGGDSTRLVTGKPRESRSRAAE